MTEDNPDRAPKVIRCEHWSEELGRFGGWHHHEGSHACDWGATMASVRTGFAWPISGTRHRIGANPPRRGMLRPVPRRLTPIPPPPPICSGVTLVGSDPSAPMGRRQRPDTRLKAAVRGPIHLDLTPLADLYNPHVCTCRNAVEFRFNM